MSAEFVGEPQSALNRRIARGAAWMVGLRFADRLVGFLSTIVLARVLVPSDFGLVALALAMVAAVGLLSEFGFELVLIQNQKAERSHYDTVWTFSVLRGFLTASIIALIAEPLASFFDDPRLVDVIFVLALMPLLDGFYNIGTVAFRKELTMGKEFVFRIVPRIGGFFVTVGCALAWGDYWALIYGSVAGPALRLVMSYTMHSHRPRLSVSAWRDIIGFSKWTLVTSIAAFANKKLSTLIIAKMLDAHSLGIFSMAAQIADMASAEMIAPIKQALFPGYAKLAHDVARLRKAFLDVYGLLVLIALPVAIGIGLTADIFVPILLGPRWSEAIPIIQILVVSGGLRALSSHVRPVYLAMNQPHLGAYASIGRMIVYLPALILVLLQYGIVGAAIAHAAGNVAVFFCSMYLMHKMLRLVPADIWSACARPLIGCALMVLAVFIVKWLLPTLGTGLTAKLLLLIMAVVAGGIAYVGTVLMLWHASGRPAACAETYLLAHFKRGVAKTPAAS